MVRRCMRESSSFGVVLIREGGEVGPAETFDVGTIAGIVDFHQLADGLLGLSCVGRPRFRIRSHCQSPDLHFPPAQRRYVDRQPENRHGAP